MGKDHLNRLGQLESIVSMVPMSFPGSLAGEESSCNAEDPGSIPGSGRSPGEGHGNPLHYSWASLLAQTVKNLPTMQETSVRSLGWENFLEKSLAAQSSLIAWRIPMDRGVHGIAKSQT